MCPASSSWAASRSWWFVSVGWVAVAVAGDPRREARGVGPVTWPSSNITCSGGKGGYPSTMSGYWLYSTPIEPITHFPWRLGEKQYLDLTIGPRGRSALLVFRAREVKAPTPKVLEREFINNKNHPSKSVKDQITPRDIASAASKLFSILQARGILACALGSVTRLCFPEQAESSCQPSVSTSVSTTLILKYKCSSFFRTSTCLFSNQTTLTGPLTS